MLHFKSKAIVITSLSILASAIFVPSSQAAGKVVTLVTHDSFVMAKTLIADFDKQSGYDLHLVKAGDAGALTNRLILTKGAPIADAVFGIDNTFAGLAKSNGLIQGKLIPTDFGDVCFNYDKLWFEQHKISVPITVKQLTSTAYKNLTVVENPNSSSTGLAFLAASVDLFGKSGWVNFWKSLKQNGVKVDSGWDAAYSTDFSGSSGKGKYPIVLSYASSPADEVRANGKSQTASFMDGCFRQTEFVGVLNGTKNPAGAAAIVKYLTGAKFQATFPSAMYMYPQIKGTPIPVQWQKFTQISTRTYGDRLDINANRKSWLAQWTAIFNG